MKHSPLSVFVYLYFILLILFTISYMVSLGQDVFGFSAGSLPNVSTTLLEFMCIVYILAGLKNKPRFTPLALIVSGWLFYVILNSAFVSDMPLYIVVRETIFWPLSFLFFYFLCARHPEFIFRSIKFYILIFIVSLFLFYKISVGRTASVVTMIENFQASVNYIYFPLLTLPWLLLSDKKRWKNIFLILIILAAFFSAKRSAIVVTGLITLIYFRFSYLSGGNKNFIGKAFVLLLFIVFIYILFADIRFSFMEYAYTRLMSVSEDGGSGRNMIWNNVIQLFSDSSWCEKIIGHGQNAVKDINFIEGKNLSAHNDFLEVLYDFGIVGLFLYLLLHLFLIKRILFLRKINSVFFLSYLVSYIIILVMSIVSHLVIYPTFFVYLTSYWGAIEGYLMHGKYIKGKIIRN